MAKDDLYKFVKSMSGDSRFAVEENLGGGFVRLKTSEAERRQAKHDVRCVEDIVIEMLRNARDAHARNIYIATSRDGNIKKLVILDDGDGIPVKLQDKIFEPRVTSKLETMVMDSWGVHGRGMALYSIKSNVDAISINASAPGLGSSFSVCIDLDILSEKTDQSSMPVLDKQKDGSYIVLSGPHNINRTVIEFALECLGKVDVYLGSPAEIAATLVNHGEQELDDSMRIFCSDIDNLPYAIRPAMATDAIDLANICNELGLEMSDRTAHRILSKKIKPCEPVLNMLIRNKSKVRDDYEVDIYKDKRGLKLSKEDAALFSRLLENAFSEISNRYYIELSDEPVIRVSKDSITVKFCFDKEL